MSDSRGERRRRWRATLWLLSVCVFWGGTFLWMKQGTEALRALLGVSHPATLSGLFLFWRFAVAAALMPLLLPASVRRMNRRAWALGFWLSLPFSAGYLLQLYGLAHPEVAPSQSAFLTSLYVVATPVIAALLYRRWPPLGVVVGVVLATIGVAFIEGPPVAGLSPGAWATLLCALVFAVHIVMTDYATRRADPLSLTLATLLFTACWTAASTLLAPGGGVLLDGAGVRVIFSAWSFVWPLFLCAVPATVIALSVLNRWQRELSPGRAAIVYTAEPLFAAAISLAAGADVFTGWLLFSASMIIGANLSVELLGLRRRVTPAPEEDQEEGREAQAH